MVYETFLTRSNGPPNTNSIHTISIVGSLTGLNEVAGKSDASGEIWPQILRRFDMNSSFVLE
jgi:hypothetical protein